MRARVQVRCPLQCPEDTGVTIQVFCLVTGDSWYVSNRKIHEDVGVPLFADHIRALTMSFDSKNPLVRQVGRYVL